MKRYSMIALLTVVAITVVAAASTVSSKISDPMDFTVHEWGTFTSIAAKDGSAIDWLPWGGPSDLPCFVDRFKNRTKASYAAKVRMETPVLYFYTNKETTVNVGVRFQHGLITEWFPHATVQPETYSDQMNDVSFAGTIAWNSVKVRPDSPAAFLKEKGQSHYYAARNTDATPLEVAGQKEKFLFYRGIGNFELPIAPTITPDGSVQFTNPGSNAVAAVILFEN